MTAGLADVLIPGRRRKRIDDAVDGAVEGSAPMDAPQEPLSMSQADFTQGRESLAQKRRRNQLTAQQLRELSAKMDREMGY